MKSVNVITLCAASDLIADSGVCVLYKNTQIALFYLPAETPALWAISNWDPISEANILSRGILGDIEGELVVASPLYKQHFSLRSGRCLEQDSQRVATFKVELSEGSVLLYP